MTDLTEKAMLVKLSISQWSARKFDKRATETVEKEFKTNGNAGRFNKLIVAQDAICEVQSASGAARTFHYEQTLPWLDDGYRILPAANFDSYSEKMRSFRSSFEKATRNFIENYPTYQEEAKNRLGNLYNKNDYPFNIETKFGFSVDIFPLPSGQDFRVNINANEISRVQKQIEDRTRETLQKAHEDLYRRLAEAVAHIIERFSAKKQIFRNSLITNLYELCELMPRLNITQDKNLEKLVKEAEKKLCQFDPDDLRKDDKLRGSVKDDAEKILNAMEGMYGSKRETREG